MCNDEQQEDWHKKMKMLIVEKFFEYRRARGWSIRVAAKHVGIHYSLLANIENRKRYPSMAVIHKIYEVLFHA